MSGTQNQALGAWIRLLKTHNLIVRESRTRLAEHCTLAQFDILAQLMRTGDGMSPAELSRRLLVTAGNVTGMVDRMEQAGLVLRKRDPQDRRAIRIQLTEKGKRKAKTVIPRHASDMGDMFQTLSDREIEQLRRLLDKLITGLENNGSPSE